MPALIVITPHLTPDKYDARLAATYQGQAHLAGAGPPDTACRESMWFASGATDAYKGTVLQPAWCTKPIANKVERLIPHQALSCMFFVANPDAPEERRRDRRRRRDA